MNQLAFPVVGVSVIVFRDESLEEVLLVERGNEPLKGYWAPPGGRVEFGETIAAAAKREVREECHISVQLPEHPSFGTVDSIGVTAARTGYHFVLVGVAALAPANAEPRAGDDAAACRWVRVDALHEIAPQVDALAEVIELAQRRLQMLG